MTTRYRLPDALGGGEINGDDRYVLRSGLEAVEVVVNGIGFLLPLDLLTEIPPPIPAEPEPGAYDIGGRLAALVRHGGFDNWVCSVDGEDEAFWDWEPLWRAIGGPDVPIRRLVPAADPAPAVELPWRGKATPRGDLRVNSQDRDRVISIEIFGEPCYLSPTTARAMAAALTAAAARQEETSDE